MEEDFYATIKFMNGEEIFTKVSSSEENGETILTLFSPIIINPIKNKNGFVSGYRVEPWLKTTEEDLFVIKKDSILTIIENNDRRMINLHCKYIQNYFKPSSNSEKLTKEMGYIGSVEDSVKLLERIYNSL
jgi:hypothetical protein